MTRGRGTTRLGRFSLAVVMLLAGIGIGAGAMVGAQSTTTYYACVNNSSGTIKMADSETQCRNNETLIQWNQQGPPGATGAPGSDGADGLDGVNCWDLNANRVDDEGEDVNGDGAFDALDCRGPQGEQGPPGAAPDLSAIEAELEDLRAQIDALQEQVEDDTSPSLSINDVTRQEGTGGQTPFTFTVTLSQPSDSTVTVEYATADGTAQAGSDYTATSGTLTFAPGETSQQIDVLVTGDGASELHETFSVALSNPGNATLLDAQGEGTIQNDDLPGVIITNAICDEGSPCVFLVRLNGPTHNTVVVAFATQNGNAVAGTDYIARTGSVVFAPGQMEQQIVINTVLDGVVIGDGPEVFFVNLSSPSNATLLISQGRGTINP